VSGVNLNVHFHTLVLDGVFCEPTPGRLQFHAATPPSDEAVAHVLGAIRHRVRRLLARRGLEPGAAERGPPDGLAEVSPILAQILSASVQGGLRSAARAPGSGAWAGADRARCRARAAPGPPGGFDLHANVWVPQ
jgi:hypothetical protein